MPGTAVLLLPGNPPYQFGDTRHHTNRVPQAGTYMRVSCTCTGIFIVTAVLVLQLACIMRQTDRAPPLGRKVTSGGYRWKHAYRTQYTAVCSAWHTAAGTTWHQIPVCPGPPRECSF